MNQLKRLNDRQQWIATAAYYKAEARGFVQGKETDDWRAAENDYLDGQVRAFLQRCHEDEGMSVHGLQNLAYTLGLPHPERIDSKTKLITEIQKMTGHHPCFRSKNRRRCQEAACEWRMECQHLTAEWA